MFPPTASSSAEQSQLLVYSLGGMLIRTITGFVGAMDVDVGVDGTVMVADYHASKVYYVLNNMCPQPGMHVINT